MPRGSFAVLLLLAGAAGLAAPRSASAQARPDARSKPAAAAGPERAVRRDIPMTDMIRRAFAAGTRDSSGRPGRNYWQLRTEYSIDARLDPATAEVTGRESVVIHNAGLAPMTALQLRLDQNIFGANAARLEPVPEITGGFKISRMSVDGVAVDLKPAPQPRRFFGPQPPPAVPTAFGLEQTSAQIRLSKPIAPGATATLEAEWSFRVPKIEGERGMRMGRWADSLYQVAQWYPRLAVFDDVREGGWDTDPYLGPSEFYNNFGHFDLRVDVPAGWTVGATGVLQNAEQVLTPAARERLAHVLDSDSVRNITRPGEAPAAAPGARVVWHFVADTVGDVAWAASDRYVWDATRATIPGRGAVPVNLLYLPGHAQSFAQVGPATRHALEFYSKLWLPYAFPQLTVVDGPEMGMEYPMLIMSGLGAADHETGHEWWPMTLGTNETWYGFMDEGFNQYMNILSGADRAGQKANLDGLGQAYGALSGNEQEAPLMWDANYGGPMYSFQAYGKAPLMLSMLGGIVGDSAVQRAMSEYAHAWRFKHPTPWDYAFFMQNALHRDLGWFWYSWLFTTDAVNGSIAAVATRGATTRVTVRQDGQMPSPVVLKVQFAPTGAAIRPMPNSVMADSATAIVTYPVDVWFGGSRTFDAALSFGGRPIQKITLDPFCRFPDRDASDNVWPRPPAAANAQAGQNGMMAAFMGRGRCQ